LSATVSGRPARRMRARIQHFADRHSWVGPTVFIASALYFVTQIVVGWVWNPPYSVINNTISDLGNTACGRYGGSYVCSPRHTLMNVAFIFLGVVMATGSLLIYQEFTERQRSERVAALIGFVCLGIGGLGAVFVGVFPENTFSFMHITGAGLAIGVGNLGILVLGLVLPLPESLRGFMLFFSTLSITALILFACHRYFGIGAGTMERIAAYPETLWLIRFGIYISRNHYSPGRAPTAATE
jgi:hypothetical membrane protein